MATAGALIAAGGLTDTVAFKSTLNLLLRQSTTLSWIMAIGATSMALVAAASIGVSLAFRRREPSASRLAIAATTIVWASLGLAMFLVRWLDATSGQAGFGFGSTSGNTYHPILVASFFLAIYVISGACTIFEVERLYNPEYFAYRRLGHQLRRQVEASARAEANVDRARSAADHHIGELDREDHRRLVAISERQALGAEAANYARILMAGLMRDPAKTGITETGPSPQPPAQLSPPPSSPLPGSTSAAGPAA
jgi:hypothetical protein